MTRKAKTLNEPKIRAALFDMIAERGLGRVRLRALAEKTGIPFADLHARYPSVHAIVEDFLCHVDREMLRHISFGSGTGKRDLYFDMMMARFDALQPYRKGVIHWLKDTAQHPTLAAALLRRWNKSLSLMLDVAGDSPVYPVKKIGLAGIYLVALRAWMEDESRDMAKTMAALDRSLGKAGMVVERFLTPKKKTKKAA